MTTLPQGSFRALNDGGWVESNYQLAIRMHLSKAAAPTFNHRKDLGLDGVQAR